MPSLTRAEALAFIRNSGGNPFTVEFIKRTTGELRIMTAQLGVPGPAGGQAAYDFAAKGLISCYDAIKQAHRTIPQEGLTRVLVDGTWRPVAG